MRMVLGRLRQSVPRYEAWKSRCLQGMRVLAVWWSLLSHADSRFHFLRLGVVEW